MNKRRRELACTVFDGEIVSYGGLNKEFLYNVRLKSVEAYDHHEDKWNFLPNMQFERCGHTAVSMGNKMFIIGGVNEKFMMTITVPSEVFDKVSNKFSCIESPRNYVECQPYCVGNKIFLITDWYEYRVDFCMYDVDKNRWSRNEKLFI